MIGDLLTRLRALDVRLWAEAGTLRYSAPAGVLTPELLAELRAGKAELLDLLRSAGSSQTVGRTIPRIPRDGDLPASFAQERLWFLEQMGLGGPAHHLPLHLRWRGPLDRAALAASLAGLVARHEALRTGFRHSGGRLVQVLHEGRWGLPVVDLGGLPPAARETEVGRLARAEMGRPFDLRGPSLLRARLLALGVADHVLLLTLHHLVADGWSLALLASELARRYDAAVTGGPSPEPGELAVQYADFAAWQREEQQGARLEARIDWWRRRLAGLAPLSLPADFPRPAGPPREGAGVRLEVPAEVAAGLRVLARERGATLYMALLGAFQAVLSRHTGQSRVAVGGPVASREQPGTTEVVGPFMNVLVLLSDLGGDPGLGELISRAREVVLGAQAHADLPFERLVEALRPERDPGRHPLFQVSFTLQPLGQVVPRPSAPGVEVSLLEGPAARVRFDLELHAWEEGVGLGGVLLYRPDLFHRTRIERLARHLVALLVAGVKDPARPLSQLPLLDGAERAACIARGQAADGGDPPGGPVALHERLRAIAASRPDAVAVVGPGLAGPGNAGDGEAVQLTYGALASRAGRLARRLRALGVGPEQPVGLCVPRSVELVVGVVGILAAGGAYLPLDPDYPSERLAYLLGDAGPGVLVTTRGPGDRLAAGAGTGRAIVWLDDESLDGEPAGWPASIQSPDGLAYIIYTSGSTGRPKGVGVSHRAVVRLFTATAPWFGFAEDRVWSLFHSAAFDFSVWEIWGALLHGGRLVVVPRWTGRSPRDLHALLCREAVTTLCQTPSAFRPLTAVDAEADSSPPLTEVIFGGEALDLASLRSWTIRHGDHRPRLVNMYGITETTVHVTYRPVGRHDVAAGGSWIGRPIPDLDLHVLDGRMEPVPEGVAGELHVGGPGLARGYLGRPALTAERFVPDPFRRGRRLYRSGDLARHRLSSDRGRASPPDLEYLGRRDVQVQLRGYRVEPGEVEAALRECPGVQDAAVVYREDGPRGPRLSAYVVPAGPVPPAPAALRRQLAERLPEYMVPGALLMVTALPLTPHGKLDRGALPQDVEPGAPGAAGLPLPEGPDEEAVATLFGELLGVGPVGRHAGFFELGGHSLLAMTLVARVRERLGVDLPVRAVFETPEVAALAAEIATRRDTGAAATVPGPAAGPTGPSPAQTRLWFLQALEPASAAYNLPLAYLLRGPLDRGRLASAVRETVRRHEVLRTVLPAVGGRPAPRLEDPGHWHLSLVDLRALSPVRRQAEARRVAAAEAGRPFRLERDWPLRVVLLRLGPLSHVLLLTLHHVAVDAWSLGLLWEALDRAYAGAAEPWPEPAVQYRDHVARQALALGDTAASTAYWQEQLRDLPVLALPTDGGAEGSGGAAAGAVPFALAPLVAGALQALGRGEGATPFMVLLAGFALLLSRHGGGPDVPVGAPVANRAEPEAAQIIGPLLNTLVLRVDLSGDPSFRVLLRRVRQVVVEAQAHQAVPFEQLVELLAPDRDLDRHPLFQVSVTLQPAGALAPRRRLGDLTAEAFEAAEPRIRFDLELQGWESEGRGLMGGVLLHRLARCSAGLARSLARRLERLLEGAAASPDDPVSALPLLAPDERALLIGRGQRRTVLTPGCLHERFAATAARWPEAIAVTGVPEAPGGGAGNGGREAVPPLTYRELDERSNQLAHHLRALGVGPETPVGLRVGRSPALVVGLLGILKAGGAYVPLDPTHPPERLRGLLDDVGAAVLVTDPAGAGSGSVPFGGPVVCLEADARAIGARPRHVPAAAAPPDRLAYVIHTSGSTGRPKGVAVTHGNVTRLFDAARGWFGFHEGMVWSLFHSAAFDFSVWELWGALLHGGRVVVVPYWVSRSPREFHALLAREGVTVLSQTPSAFRGLIAADEAAAGLDGPPPLRLTHVVFGGEALDFRMLRPWVERHGDERPQLVNMYGITETTVHVTYRRLRRADLGERRSLLGAPLPDLDLHLLDGAGEPVPDGVPGELFVGGAGLARGYLGQERLTRERFVPHPFRPGDRLYRTGDRARRANGDLEYLGRVDAQVQLRGFRVEPGEVEAVLRDGPGVGEAVVMALDVGPRGLRLAGFVVPAPGASVDGPGLRRMLAERLPEHLVPASVLVLDALPLTGSGKLDLAALRERETTLETSTIAPPAVGPRAEDEALLSGLWAEVLGTPPPGLDAGFFELGGHSLLAARLVSRVRDAFEVELPLRQVFERPTLGGLLRTIRDARQALDARPLLPPVTPAAAGSLPVLAPAQERIWFLDQLEGGAPTFVVPLAVRLRGPVGTARLAEALAGLIERHAVLRTRIVLDGDVPRPAEDAPGRLPVALVDLSGLDGAAAARAEEAALGADADRAFDLTREWPLRALLVRHGPGHHVLALALHHVAVDGWSLGILWRDLAMLYRAAGIDGPAGLEPLPVRYGDYAAWQHRHLDGAALAPDLAWWRARLDGLPPALALPPDHPPPPLASSRGRTLAFQVDAAVAARLGALAVQAGATPFMALLAAYAALLVRLSGQTDLAIGIPVAGRPRVELEPLVGCFLNTLVLRIDAGAAPTFRELVGRVRRAVLEAYDHQAVPFERLVEALVPGRRPGQTPLIQTMFDLAPAGAGLLDLPGVVAEVVARPARTAKFDVSLSMVDAGGGLAGCWECRADLFDASTLARWTDRLLALLAEGTLRPDEPLSRLALAGGVESASLEGQAAGALPPGDLAETLPSLLTAQAGRTPDRVAVAGPGSDGTHLTYAALQSRARRLARRLQGQGVGPEAVVGVLLPRSPELVVALLATGLAGGAYLPLDPDHPAPRLRAVRRLGEAEVVVTFGSLAPVVAEPGLTIVDMTGEDEAGPHGEPASPARPVEPGALAYVLFTSGSTGSPKGVMVPHGALAAFTRSAVAVYDIDAADRVLQFASASFDTAAEELFPALASGAAVVLRAEALAGPAELMAAAARDQVTVLDLPTAYWHELVADLAAGAATLPGSVRLVVIGGERARPAALEAWHGLPGPRPRLLNTYGPTEATVVATVADVSRPGRAARPAEVPIGRPLPGVEARVLDARGWPLLTGEPGELCLGGAGLARGYLGRPGETAERFRPGPAPAGSARAGARLYRTGDRVRALEQGQLEFLGRLDSQVKVRGHRVEPGEAEALLLDQPGVREAAVVWQGDESGQGRLVAYVAPEAADVPALRAALQARLPDALVPSTVVALPALPRTAGGKVDRRVLSDRGAGTSGPRAPETGAPEARDPIELQVAGIWADLLRLERVGLDQSFFDLGGHSLLLLALQRRLREELGRDVRVVDLFRFPTVRALAGHLAGDSGEGTGAVKEAQAAAARQRAALARLRSRTTRPRGAAT